MKKVLKLNSVSGSKIVREPRHISQIFAEMASQNSPLAALLRKAMVEPSKGKEVRK